MHIRIRLICGWNTFSLYVRKFALGSFNYIQKDTVNQIHWCSGKRASLIRLRDMGSYPRSGTLCHGACEACELAKLMQMMSDDAIDSNEILHISFLTKNGMLR